MDQPLEALVRGIRRGEYQTLHDFYYTYGRVVSTFLIRMNLKKEDVSDLTQDVLLRIWQLVTRRRITCGTVKDANNYVRKSAINAANSLFRKRKREEKDISLDDYDQAIAIKGVPDKTVDSGAAVDVRRYLGVLPADQRRVLILQEVEGYTYEEIAEQCGYTEGQVRGKLERAKKTLRKIL
jgi:RNA polymerase sigma-70 factor (ECF subfamily)